MFEIKVFHPLNIEYLDFHLFYINNNIHLANLFLIYLYNFFLKSLEFLIRHLNPVILPHLKNTF